MLFSSFFCAEIPIICIKLISMKLLISVTIPLYKLEPIQFHGTKFKLNGQVIAKPTLFIQIFNF